MANPEKRSAAETSEAPRWPTSEQDNFWKDNSQMLITVGLIIALIVGFLGICVPMFLL